MKWLKRFAPTPEPMDGAEAKKRAEKELDKTMAQTPEFERLGQRLRRERQMNGLSELFAGPTAKESH